MKASFIASLFAFAAATAVAQYTTQSAPFYLIVLSQNATLNGTALDACHEGAAIEGLCRGGSIAPSTASTTLFQFNTSSSSNTTVDQAGYLSWELRGGNFNLSEPMGLAFNPVSNVAVPLFTPGNEDSTLVSFDKNDLMNIGGYLDDRVVPPTQMTQQYYRWYICTTYYGYTYETLAWVLGQYPPENPSCQKVHVKRVFA
ncbi:hypothetical protein AOQ84DRAFT_197696 [Glonium stellatum]|uniref:DUF7907 domain-containing protein n=1 Tax=Glonium stellatum TaxID=574774 RepID=A0A8E2EP13_9PEZI|nr:hypothetical protein AOQ84DRAFT_197696 [Glonium stellatum]